VALLDGLHFSGWAWLTEHCDETRLIVSEPLGTLAGAWNEVPETSYGVIRQGQDELKTFTRDQSSQVLVDADQSGRGPSSKVVVV
jgi:hypothetical protein